MLFSPEPEPDEVERPAHAQQEARQGQITGVKDVLIGEIARPAPEDQP